MIQSLQAMLATHHAKDEMEGQALAKHFALAANGDISFDRSFFTPGHFTASAFCLSPNEESILLIFHPGFKSWIQPGGHFDEQDLSPLHAAKRELYEETGVRDAADLKHLDLDVHHLPSIKGQPPHVHCDLRFWFRAKSNGLDLQSAEHKMAWMPLKTINKNTTDSSVFLAVQRWIRFKARN